MVAILNDLEQALPTIGAVGLPLTADVLTGGLATPADAALAGIGGGLGKAGENLAQNKSAFNDVPQTAGEMAAFQGAGDVAGGVLGKLGSKLTGVASNAADKTSSDALAGAYSGVKRGLQQSYDAVGQTNFAKGLGIDASNPQNLVDTGNQANDILNSNLSDTLAQNGPVDLSNYNQMVKDAIAKESGTLGSYDKVALTGKRLAPANTPASKLLSQLEQQGMGVARTQADPSAVRELLQKVQSAAVDAKPTVAAATGAIDPTQKASYNVLNDVAAQLKKALYNRPEMNDAVKAIQGNIQAGDVGGSQELANHLNGVLTNAATPQDLLNELSRFTNMSKLGQAGLTAQKALTPTATAGASVAGIPTAAGHLATGNPLTALTHLVANNAPKAAGVAGHAANILARIPPAVGTAAGGALQAASNNMNQSDQGGAMTPTADITQGGAGAIQPQQPVVSPVVWQSLIDSAGAGDPYNQSAGALGSAAGTLTDQIQKAVTANQLLQTLEQLRQQSTGGAGGTGSILDRMASLFGGAGTPNVRGNYASTAQTLQGLLSGLGINAQAPSLMLNQPTANADFGGLQSMITAQGGGMPQSAVPTGLAPASQ